MTKKLTLLMGLMLFGLTALAQNPNTNLVAYWPLNDGTNGQAVSGADDVIDAGLTFTDATVEGSGGIWSNDSTRGIVFSTGENDRLVGGTQGIDLNLGFTWSLWVNMAASNLSDPGADVIMGTRVGGPFHKFQVTSIANWVSISGYNLADDQWHHIALAGDTNGVRLYIDGQFFAEDTTAASPTYNGKLEFGGSSGFSEDVTGLMSDIAIWHEALSTNRIAALAAGGAVILDATPPVLSNLSPSNTATEVEIGANLIATFDDPIVVLAGDVVITNLTDSTEIVISVPGPDPDGMVRVEGNRLIVDPAANLETSTVYAVRFGAGLIENETGFSFPGITNNMMWRFTTGGADTSGPVLVATDPANGAMSAEVSGDLVATFDENIDLVNGGMITISNLTEGTSTTNTLPDAAVSVSGGELTIDPSADLAFGDTYAVLIGSNALEDSSGNRFAGILDSTTWRFTADMPPVISLLSPPDNASGVDTRSDLVITFDEDIALVEGG
ncbi:MAG: Ig-like domain-containing protein, partial [Verrucomicrobiota bacterium]